MIGETAITGAAQSASAARTPGTARIGSMLMNGLDGQIDHCRQSRVGQCGQEVRMRRAPSSAPWNASSCTTGSQRRCTK